GRFASWGMTPFGSLLRPPAGGCQTLSRDGGVWQAAPGDWSKPSCVAVVIRWARSMTRLVLVCLGGAVGSGLRYLAAVGAVRLYGDAFPYGTLAVNLVGCFLIGVINRVA